MTLQVNADTAERARRQAIAQARAMGYSTVIMARVLPQQPPDVTDAFAMGAAVRSFEVQLGVTR